MTSAAIFHERQREKWNGDDGLFWVERQERLDRVLAPVHAGLMAFATPAAGETALDIGCGCGATTVALAEAVGPSGRVVGLDVSEPMLARAAERLRPFPNATCLYGDAATRDLTAIGADLVVSRFGVMFFGDPAAAFANIRRGMAPGGRLRFACWRTRAENRWMDVPYQAACEHVPMLPPPEPEEPGPLSFADPVRVARILTAAGFGQPSFTPLDFELDISGGEGLDVAVQQSASMGPTKRALADQPEELRAAAMQSIRRALEPYTKDGRVLLAAAVWLVSAE